MSETHVLLWRFVDEIGTPVKMGGWVAQSGGVKYLIVYNPLHDDPYGLTDVSIEESSPPITFRGRYRQAMDAFRAAEDSARAKQSSD